MQLLLPRHSHTKHLLYWPRYHERLRRLLLVWTSHHRVKFDFGTIGIFLSYLLFLSYYVYYSTCMYNHKNKNRCGINMISCSLTLFCDFLYDVYACIAFVNLSIMYRNTFLSLWPLNKGACCAEFNIMYIQEHYTLSIKRIIGKMEYS